MTDLTRSSTLSLRRPTAALTSRPKAVSQASSATSSNVPPSASRNTEPADSAERAIRSDTLLQGRSHVSITHNGETYQLRATRLGKLILTK
ncbi:hemin uptake protein HemP [Paraburkholderia flava]|uniref:hemin uptake protein HemP n=1 Tax=Paraburkholderia flava TaxID=2547393 RepID=UPI00105F34DD|nr:hemin uptake protein HemP [Paraburkholderia flava]